MKIKIEDLFKGLNVNQINAVKIENNAVISAGAGSGKTKVLASRYVYFVVKKNISVENIIALTFTEKAAGEMHKRIYDTLKKIDHPNAEIAVEKFHLAKISTIDSFCNSIARFGCKNFGISPDFIIDNEKDKKLAYRVALDFFLAHRSDKTMQFFLADKTIESFIENLFLKLLTKYVYVSRPMDFMKSFNRQADYYSKLKNASIQEFISITDLIFEGIEKNKFIDEAIEILKSPDYIRALLEAEQFDEALTLLRKISVSKKGGGAVKEIKSDLKKYIVEFESAEIFEKSKNHLYRLFELLTELQEVYISKKKQTGVLTFSDVSHLALDALITDVELRNFYKQNSKIIMIDEFQDNNSLQRDLLFLLAENRERSLKTVPQPEELLPNKLFFVGDEKQSIYAFRGADVSVFRKLSNEISSKEEMDAARLSINYRTEPVLIDLFNFIFSKVFYSETNKYLSNNLCIPSYEAEYLPTGKRGATEEVSAKLEILFFDKSRLDNIENKNFYLSEIETEAYYLAKRIIEMKNSEMPIKKGTGAAPCDWNDFAVLMRTGSNQPTYERVFRKFGIPYRSLQQKGLFKDAPVNDLYAMLKILVYPEDVKTYSQVLRSPFVNIDDDAFAVLIINFKTAFEVQLAEKLSGTNKDAYIYSCNLFERIKQNAITMNCAELITHLWYNEGYRYFLLSKDENIRYLEFYDFIFELAQQADLNGLTLQQFVDILSGYIEDEKRLDDMDIPIEQNENAVSFLTIHKSKGLEFPIVIIPNCNYEGEPVKSESVFYSEEFGVVVYTPKISNKEKNIIFESMREEANDKLIAETKRLLYVAATRAESYLIISAVDDTGKICGKNKSCDKIDYSAESAPADNSCGSLSLSEIKKIFAEQVKDDVPLKSFIRMLIPALPDNHENIIFTELMPQKRDVLYVKQFEEKKERRNFSKIYAAAKIKEFCLAEKKIIAATQVAQNELKLSEEKVYSFDLKNEELQNNDFLNFTAAQLGSIAHEAIEAKLLHKDFIYPEGSGKKVSVWVNNFFNSQIYMLAKNAVNFHTEYAFLTEYENKLVSGQIDLMFQTSDCMYIIDYKTDEIEIPENHKIQLSIYKKAASDLVTQSGKNLKVRAYVFYLKTGNYFEIL